MCKLIFWGIKRKHSSEMVLQENFEVEQFMDRYETGIKYNMGESCVDSLSVKDLTELVDPKNAKNIQQQLSDAVFETKLTYGYIQGSEMLKSAISKIYNEDIERNQSSDPIGPENLIVTNGAIGGNFLLFYTMVNTGDHVVVIDPNYQQLSSVPNVFSNGNVTKFGLKFENGYRPDLEKLRNVISEKKTKLLVINNPNNPTGVVWDNELLEDIIGICRKNDTYVFCDEAYRPLYHSVESPPKSILNFGYDKAISTSSTSKAFSFAGLRVGWIACRDKDLLTDMLSKRDYNTISVSIVDDILATFVLNNYKVILKRNYELCKENLKLIEDFVNESLGRVAWVKPQGGTTCFLKFTNSKIDTFKMTTELAENHGLLIVPGETFDNKKGFIRIGFGNSAANVLGGLSVLRQWLKNEKLW